MDKLKIFKEERSFINRHLSVCMDAQRSKFEVDDRKIAGYPIVWNEKNDFSEIVIKGATLNSLNARGVEALKNPIVVLNQHRQAEILCRPSVLLEDDYGLYFEGEVIQGVRYADEALAQIRQGVLKQLSYGFDYIYDKVEYSSALDAYVLREIKLFEISTITFSSGDSAQLRGYKGMQATAVLNKYPGELLEDLNVLLSLSGAATSTPETDKGDLFDNFKKLF
ncbi:MAG: HK97 family phage prohead protease [Prevotella sp.]|jgi:HK97 family phage prohead protease|nr:HK97 family phage prohead protease [Prevotella sp.]